ncbi:MAG TPA: hypothetical protein VF514_00820 [Bacteroidota bacterium]
MNRLLRDRGTGADAGGNAQSYHRAQNAVRLHELGGTPPGGDFIAWLWKGRPEPDWG